MPAEVGASGEFAAGILASDSARQGGQLLAQINRELSANLPGWRLEVAERGGMHTIFLTSQHDETLRVNLADTGTGVAQVLPVFVQRAVDILTPPRRPVLEIIEQPELHLHPAAHAALADLYLAAADTGASRFLIETHSETFLLRLRRRIAEGRGPGTVAVYFIDHTGGTATTRPIMIDERGGLDYWPTGVFSEDYDETRAIAVAQLERGGDRAS
jgi:predicted ATPase